MKNILGRIAFDPADAERLRCRIAGRRRRRERLHDASCLGCHDTCIYTRKDRLADFVTSRGSQIANKQFADRFKSWARNRLDLQLRLLTTVAVA
jgi:hypothetical protein